MQNNMRHKPHITSLVYGKVPPQAPDLEEAVLGALMLESDRFDEVYGIIPSPDCFYKDDHQAIYAEMITLSNSGKPIDLLTISDSLRKAETLERAGGDYNLTKLTMNVTSSAHIEAHCRIIMEMHIKRELIRLGGRLVAQGYEDFTDAFDLLDEAQKDLSDLATENMGNEAQHISIGVKEMLADVEQQMKNETVLTGLDTGLKELNRVTNGWQPTDLIIIAARPSKGKTALGLNLAYYASASEIVQQASGLIFSLEMSRKQLIQRMASMVSNTPFENIRNGKLSEGELMKLINDSTKLSRRKIWIDDRGGLSISQLKAKAKKYHKKHGIGFILIDYIQLMRGEQKGNREQEISSISRELKVLAKDLNIPVIALSQLNRDVDKRSSPRPVLADLRESGAIEQDADNVMFIYHEQDGNDESKIRNMLSVAKARNGICEDIEVKFLGHLQKWIDKDDFEIFGGVETFKPFAGMRNVLPPEKDDLENFPFGR